MVVTPGVDWTPERVDELRRLWDEGHSGEEIGRRMRLSKNSVIGKAHRLKLPGRPNPVRPHHRWKEEELDLIRASHPLGARALAQNLGRSIASVTECARRLGIPFDGVKAGPPRSTMAAATSSAASLGVRPAAPGLSPQLAGPPQATSARPVSASAERGASFFARSCQWIEGEPRSLLFCGAPSQAGSSFCELHHKRCWHTAKESDMEIAS